MLRDRIAAAVALVVLGAARGAAASPEDLYGYGVHGPSMGGAGSAAAITFEAAWANPALASRFRTPRLTLGVQGATFDLSATPGPPLSVPGAAAGALIGVELPLPLGGALRDRIGLALAFYTPDDLLVRGRILYPEVAQFPLLPDRAQCLTIRAGFGVDLGYGLRAGAGFGALAEIVGTVVVATDATGRVGSTVEDQLVTTYAPTFGASWEHALWGGTFRVGAAFRGAQVARFEVLIDGTKLSSLAIPVFNISGVAQYDPLQVPLEMAWEKGPWRLTGGVTFKHWADWPGPLEPTVQCPKDAPDCGALVPPRPGASSTVVPRVGAERALHLTKDADAFLRAGWFFEPSPLPTQLPSSTAFDVSARAAVQVPTRWYDGARHAVTIGGGVRVGKALTVDVWSQLHLIVPHEVTLAAGGAGGSDAKVQVSGTTALAGIAVGVGF
jgi:long-chain fatty acid transport protein